MIKAFAHLFMLMILTGCVSESERSDRRLEAEKRAQNDRAFAALSAEDFAICEAVFRYQFAHNASSFQSGAPVYFVEIYGNDPSPDFIARFGDVAPPVRNGSKFKVGHGLHFRVSKIRIVDEKSAEVSGGYYEGNLSSSGNTYSLEKKNGVWLVVRDEMHWISALPNQLPEPTRVAVTIPAGAGLAPATRVAHR